MKKIYLAIAASAVLCATATAQGLYVRGGVGYNLALTTTAYEESVATPTSTTTTFKGVNLAKGIVPSLTLGYMFNKNVGIELAAGYSLGSDNVVTSSYPAGPATRTDKETIHSRMLALYPSVRLEQQLGFSKTSIYTRAGLAIPVAGYTDVKRDIKVAAGTNMVADQNIEVKLNGQPTLGVSGALGFQFAINPSTALFAEINGQALKVWGKKLEITKYYDNLKQTDILQSMKPYDKQTNFVKTLNASSNNKDYNSSYNVDKPKDELRGKEANFDAVGFAIGVHIRL